METLQAESEGRILREASDSPRTKNFAMQGFWSENARRFSNKCVRKTLRAIPAILLFSPLARAEYKEFAKWLAGKSPREVGELVAERFAATPHKLRAQHAA